jgi:hypothetical protein
VLLTERFTALRRSISFYFGSAHDKNGPAVPGRTPDRVKRSTFCGPRSITNLVYIVFVVYAKVQT